VLGSVAANGRAGAVYYDENDTLVVTANVQNVARRTFYQRGQFWEDAGLKDGQKFVQIKQFSDAHFKLLKAYPKLSQYSTLGNLRLVLDNSNAVEIGPEGKESMSDDEMLELTRPAGPKGSGAAPRKPGSVAGVIAALAALGVTAVVRRTRG